MTTISHMLGISTMWATEVILMNLEEIKNYLNENKEDEEVQALLKEFNSINQDDIKDFLDTDDGQKLLQPRLDSYFTKGLNTWKENNLDKLVAEKLKEINPEQTPEQIELQQMKAELEEMKNAKIRESLKNTALTQATEKNIPTSLVDYLLGTDEETTTANLETFEEAMKQYVDKQVKQRISDSSYEPPADDESGKAFTKEQIASMSPEEINKNWNEIKDLV